MILTLISISLFLMEMFRAPFLWCIYISKLIHFARVCSYVDDVNNRILVLTAKILKQRYRCHKIRKAFSKFYHRHSDFVVKYSIGLKTLLQQGISEPIFYGDLVCTFKRIVGKPNFSIQFKKIIKRYICADRYLKKKLCLRIRKVTINGLMMIAGMQG